MIVFDVYKPMSHRGYDRATVALGGTEPQCTIWKKH